MSTLKLQEQIIAKIENTKDEQVLQGILKLIEFENEETQTYNLNEEQIIAVNEAQEQIKSGHFYTNDEVNIFIEKWLKK